MGGEDRHTTPLGLNLIEDEAARAVREAENGLRQADLLVRLIDEALAAEKPFRLRASVILNLNRTAIDGLSSYAGTFRPFGVKIGGSTHVPVDASRVAEEVEDFCAIVNENWQGWAAVKLAAYAMWRLNWIHPFADGNGRTARALSYMLLCVRIGHRLPGTPTIPEQIAADKPRYYRTLEDADRACVRGALDVSHLEDLLKTLLARQLLSVISAADQP